MELNKTGLSKNLKENIDFGIERYLIGRTVTLGGEKILFTEKLVRKNKEKIYYNIKKYLIYLMNIESSGGIIDIENEISGAKGVMQWKDGFIKGIKSNRKGDEYDSKSGSYSPFMTALRRANKFYTNQKDNKGEYLLGDFNSEKIPHYIYKAYKKGRLDINEFDSDKQIQLWFMDTIMRGGKSREYLMGIMLGNGWSAKMLYNKIHHTKVKGNTNDLVQENSKKIFPQFKKIS